MPLECPYAHPQALTNNMQKTANQNLKKQKTSGMDRQTDKQTDMSKIYYKRYQFYLKHHLCECFI